MQRIAEGRADIRCRSAGVAAEKRLGNGTQRDLEHLMPDVAAILMPLARHMTLCDVGDPLGEHGEVRTVECRLQEAALRAPKVSLAGGQPVPKYPSGTAKREPLLKALVLRGVDPLDGCGVRQHEGGRDPAVN